jgi:hypothetical protein
MSDSPSARIIAAANQTAEIKTPAGRVLKVRKLGALDRAKLFKAIGPVQAQNAPYFGYAFLAAHVTQVDELPIPFPTRDSQIEAAIDRLDNDGLDAVAIYLASLDSENEKADEPDA